MDSAVTHNSRASRSRGLCGGMALALLLLVVSPAFAWQDLRSPSEIDGSRSPATDPSADGLMAQGDDQARSKQLLVRDLENLIPGEFEPDSASSKSIEGIIEAFQSQQGTEVVKRIEAFVDGYPDAPPADVLLAALSFTTDDDRTGQLLLERASRNHPDHPAVYAAFSRLAVNSGRTTDALALLEKLQSLLESTTQSEAASRFYRTQWLDGMIDVALKQQRLDDARQYLEEQRQRLPEHPKVLMVSAELEFREGKLETCLGYLGQLKQQVPNSRAPEAILASWYQRTERPEEAESWIRKAAEKYPDDPQVQLEFASWALNEEDFPTASAAIGRAEAAGRETPFSRNLKGKIAFARQSWGVAENHYQALAEQQPTDLDITNMYALSLVEADEPEKQYRAAEIATRNFRAAPNNRVALASLGYIMLRRGDLKQAGAIFTRASQMNGNSPEIDYFIARYLQQSGETAKAKQFVKRALDREGLFLYRTAAKQLQRELDEQELPTPDTSR